MTRTWAGLLLMLMAVAGPAALAQAPTAGSGRAPVPNIRAPLPQADPAASAPATSPTPQSRPPVPSDNDRQLPSVNAAWRVVDGDTIRHEGRTYRLWGIDAPELIQVCQREGQGYACGREAAAFLRTLLASSAGETTAAGAPAQLVCVPRASDQFGRTAALCRLGDKDIGAEMVRAGWALVFTKHSSDYAAEEDEARQEKRGLWSGTFDMPWEWRAKRLGE